MSGAFAREDGHAGAGSESDHGSDATRAQSGERPGRDGPREPVASEELLPIMYHELRSLARARLHSHTGDGGGHTLQPTALVHEAYLRLTGGANAATQWNGPGHFFGAAAEAMRHVLVDHARAKGALKRGGDRQRLSLDDQTASELPDDLLLVSEAVDQLAREDELLGTILKLRYFAGLGREETAAAVDMPLRTFDRRWRYIVARLRELYGPGQLS